MNEKDHVWIPASVFIQIRQSHLNYLSKFHNKQTQCVSHYDKKMLCYNVYLEEPGYVRLKSFLWQGFWIILPWFHYPIYFLKRKAVGLVNLTTDKTWQSGVCSQPLQSPELTAQRWSSRLTTSPYVHRLAVGVLPQDFRWEIARGACKPCPTEKDKRT